MQSRSEWIKRAIDITSGLVLIALVLPVVLILAVGLAVSLRTWPFFVQKRVGRDGKLFRFFKLRTLPRSCPTYASKYDLDLSGLPWLPRTLRRRHLDELPQLFHVVHGTMSLVGPRPEQPWAADELAPAFAARRVSLRPGCTGLWQISHRSLGLIGESPAYDDLYVESSSLRLDVWILWRTLLLFASGGKMIDLSDIPAPAIPATSPEPAPLYT